ncbi:hypothetical protein GCM10022215_26660 [Nocardioides fonticola]|uniref:PAS domain-containing protein n=1 Tax=Nocardioides fonticola TaxID=450363 RepID=A0ABP7XLY4_9ACTN
MSEQAGAPGPEGLSDAVLATTSDAVVAIDAEGIVTDWNHASERLFGYSAEEVIGTRMVDRIIPEEFRAAHVAGLARVLATGESRVTGRPLSLLARHRDGRRLPVEITIWRTEGRIGPHFHAFVRDVGATRQNELLLQRALTRLRRFADLLPGAAVVLVRRPQAPSGYACSYVSAGWPDAWGRSPDAADAGLLVAALGTCAGRTLAEHLQEAERDMRTLDLVFTAEHRDGARTRVRAAPMLESGRLAWEILAIDLPSSGV